MANRRVGTAMVGLAVVAAMLGSPAGAVAQVDEITIAPGPWQGSVFFAGNIQRVGPENAGASIVTSSEITMDFVADEHGTITSGTMEVDISWTLGSSGVHTSTSDLFGTVTSDFYDISSNQHQTDTLELSGTIQRLVATGTLDWTKEVYDTEGNFLDTVSGTQPEDQVWVFEASSSDCGLLTGVLVDVKGIGLMRSVILPIEFDDDGIAVLNRLVSVSRIWFDSIDLDADAISTSIEILEEISNEVTADPDAGLVELLALVIVVEKLREQLAELDICQLADQGFPNAEAGEEWLAGILRTLSFAALQKTDKLTTGELIFLVGIASRGGALSGPEEAVELFEAFEQALTQKLAEAVDTGDFDTVQDIAATAAANGFSNLYDDAQAALTSLK